MAISRFSMDGETLVTLGKNTSTQSDDLGTLVKSLVDAAEPIAHDFNGPAKTSFNNFKNNADGIANKLNAALAGIVGSIAGQNTAFVTGTQDASDEHKTTDGAQDYSSEGLLGRIAPAAQA